jgi:hypothetical protein
VGVAIGDAVLQLAAEQVEVEARIGDQVLRRAVFRVVGEHEGRRREAVELVAALGPDRAQVEPGAIGEGDLGRAGEIGVVVAIILWTQTI